MRGKKAKELRRLAEKMTVGAVEKSYITVQGTTKLTPGTTRSVYQKLKKQL